MLTVYSDDHRLRNVRTELHGGLLVPPHECPERAGFVLERLRAVGLGDVVAPVRHGLDPVLRVHDAGFVEFLGRAWRDWEATGNRGEAIPDCWPARRMAQRRPDSIAGQLGYYAMAGETSIGPGTWEAVQAAADVALSGAKRLAGGERGVFSLCRPPGHHAARDLYGGYCFLNNAAIAAQSLRDGGAARVAILDVDFHHGNGTQDIFYDRDDMLFVSLHGDPLQCFPYFSGHADETGAGAGLGFNLNLPMPRGTAYDGWSAALSRGLDAIRAFRADALVVSLGVDTYEGDPISSFKLSSDDFSRYGRAIGGLGLPTLFVMEGGYAVADIGINVVNVLTGFEGS
jgi:acetoin utilization deacetylase AcuC-like enzyme